MVAKFSRNTRNAAVSERMERACSGLFSVWQVVAAAIIAAIILVTILLANSLGDSDTPASFVTESDSEFCMAGEHECSSLASCISLDDTYGCSCNDGYDGDGIACADVDECSLGIHTCNRQAACINIDGSFACECGSDEEWEGATETCEAATCDSIFLLCHVEATCAQLSAGPTCFCNTGYRGIGTECEDVDECEEDSHDCHVAATCTNTVGSYSCICNAGYAGDGLSCYYGADECSTGTHTCDPNASCFDGGYDYTCTCNTGYEGDGFGCVTCPTGSSIADTETMECECDSGYEEISGTCTALVQPQVDGPTSSYWVDAVTIAASIVWCIDCNADDVEVTWSGEFEPVVSGAGNADVATDTMDAVNDEGSFTLSLPSDAVSCPGVLTIYAKACVPGSSTECVTATHSITYEACVDVTAVATSVEIARWESFEVVADRFIVCTDLYDESITGFTYSWTSDVDTWHATFQRNARTLVYPGSVVAADATYSFSVVVCIEETVDCAVASVSVAVEHSPLVAELRGGNGTHFYGNDLVLDASGSYDPDGETISYDWICVLVESDYVSGGCNVELSSEATQTIPWSDLDIGVFVFRVILSTADGRAANATQVVDVSQYSGPDVFLSFTGLTAFPSHRKLIIQADVSSFEAGGFTLYWQQDYDSDSHIVPLDSGNVILTSRTASAFVLSPGILHDGEYYRFRLDATDTSGVIWRGVDVTVAVPPTIGSLSASPSSGYTLETIFTLAAQDCTNGYGGIDYRFYAVVDDATVYYLSGWQSTYYTECSLPVGSASNDYYVDVYAQVRSKWSRAETSKKIASLAVYPPVDGIAAAGDLYSYVVNTARAGWETYRVQYALSDLYATLGSAGRLVEYYATDGTNGTAYDNTAESRMAARRVLLEVLDDVRSHQMLYSDAYAERKDDLAVIARTLIGDGSEVSVGSMQHALQVARALVEEGLLVAYADVSDDRTLSDTAVDAVAQVLGRAGEAAGSTYDFADVLNITISLGLGLARASVPGEDPVCVGSAADGLQVSYQRLDVSSLSELAGGDENYYHNMFSCFDDANVYEIPLSAFASMEEDRTYTLVGVAVETTDADAAYNTSMASVAVAAYLYDELGEETVLLGGSGPSEPSEVSLSIFVDSSYSGDGFQVACAGWVDGSWDTSSCSSQPGPVPADMSSFPWKSNFNFSDPSERLNAWEVNKLFYPGCYEFEDASMDGFILRNFSSYDNSIEICNLSSWNSTCRWNFYNQAFRGHTCEFSSQLECRCMGTQMFAAVVVPVTTYEVYRVETPAWKESTHFPTLLVLLSFLTFFLIFVAWFALYRRSVWRRELLLKLRDAKFGYEVLPIPGTKDDTIWSWSARVWAGESGRLDGPGFALCELLGLEVGRIAATLPPMKGTGSKLWNALRAKTIVDPHFSAFPYEVPREAIPPKYAMVERKNSHINLAAIDAEGTANVDDALDLSLSLPAATHADQSGLQPDNRSPLKNKPSDLPPDVSADNPFSSTILQNRGCRFYGTALVLAFLDAHQLLAPEAVELMIESATKVFSEQYPDVYFCGKDGEHVHFRLVVDQLRVVVLGNITAFRWRVRAQMWTLTFLQTIEGFWNLNFDLISALRLPKSYVMRLRKEKPSMAETVAYANCQSQCRTEAELAKAARDLNVRKEKEERDQRRIRLAIANGQKKPPQKVAKSKTKAASGKLNTLLDNSWQSAKSTASLVFSKKSQRQMLISSHDLVGELSMTFKTPVSGSSDDGKDKVLKKVEKNSAEGGDQHPTDETVVTNLEESGKESDGPNVSMVVDSLLDLEGESSESGSEASGGEDGRSAVDEEHSNPLLDVKWMKPVAMDFNPKDELNPLWLLRTMPDDVYRSTRRAMLGVEEKGDVADFLCRTWATALVIARIQDAGEGWFWELNPCTFWLADYGVAWMCAQELPHDELLSAAHRLVSEWKSIERDERINMLIEEDLSFWMVTWMAARKRASCLRAYVEDLFGSTTTSPEMIIIHTVSVYFAILINVETFLGRTRECCEQISAWLCDDGLDATPCYDPVEYDVCSQLVETFEDDYDCDVYPEATAADWIGTILTAGLAAAVVDLCATSLLAWGVGRPNASRYRRPSMLLVRAVSSAVGACLQFLNPPVASKVYAIEMIHRLTAEPQTRSHINRNRVAGVSCMGGPREPPLRDGQSYPTNILAIFLWCLLLLFGALIVSFTFWDVFTLYEETSEQFAVEADVVTCITIVWACLCVLVVPRLIGLCDVLYDMVIGVLLCRHWFLSCGFDELDASPHGYYVYDSAFLE